MRVLLPPSESKRPDGGNAIFTPEELSFHPQLGCTREHVREALVALTQDEARADRVFKLGPKSKHELAHNLNFSTAHGLPAIERYIGVLFDEIELETLAPDARSWIDEHVLIQSALFGVVTAQDQIPPYRLSAGTRLTDELGATVKRTWNSAFEGFEWPASMILDLRSADYAALAPIGPPVTVLKLDIVQRSADGSVKALNHFNKRAKGDLVKRLARSNAALTTPADFTAWAQAEGLELWQGETPGVMTLVTELAPAGR